MEPQEFIDSLNDTQALWLTLYGECRGEPIEAIIGIANVIRNRVKETGKTYKEVCTRGIDLYHHQFSCWNENDPNLKEIMNNYLNTTDPIIKELKFIAFGTQSGELLDNTHNSNHYLTVNLYRNHPPDWAVNKNAVYHGLLGHTVFITCP